MIAFLVTVVAMASFARATTASRIAGALALGLALVLLLRTETASVAPVLWIMMATVAGLLVTLVASYVRSGGRS